MKEIGQHHRDCHDTEMDGAEHIAPQLETLRKRVFGLFERFGPMTDEELLDRYLERYEPIYKNSIEPRRYELVQEGKLEKSELKRPGRSGVNRIVWQIAGPSGQKDLFPTN